MATLTKEQKHAQAWQAWTATLPRSTSRTLRRQQEGIPELPTESVPQPSVTDETMAFQAFRESLPPSRRKTLDRLGMPASPPVPTVEQGIARPCLVECPDGDWPVLRVFTTFEALAKRISELEGEDMAVWAFYGVPLRFTKGPQRYLDLPNKLESIQIPIYPGGPCRRVSRSLLEGLEVQEDCFLGPDALANTLMTSKLQPPAVPTAPAATGSGTVAHGTGACGDPDEQDDPDDEGEDGAGEPVHKPK